MSAGETIGFGIVAFIMVMLIAVLGYNIVQGDIVDSQVELCITKIGPVSGARDWCEAIVATKGK